MGAKFKLACHVITWRGEQQVDPEHVMQEVKAAGWDAVEGFSADSAEQCMNLAVMAARNGLHLVNMGGPTDYQRARNNCTLGNHEAEITAAWKRNFGGPDMTDDDFARAAKTLVPAVRVMKRHGLKPFHHAHVGTLIETIEDADKVFRQVPDLQLLLDTGHLMAAGSDPLEALRRFGDRIAHVHLKDTWVKDRATHNHREARYGEDWCFIELGEGSFGVDFAAILKGLEAIGYDGWVSVEQDTSTQPAADCARQNREFLRSLGY